MQLLHIDSSVLGPNSASRALSAEIVARHVALHPGTTMIHRDLAADAALHLSSAHLAAWQGGAEAWIDRIVVRRQPASREYFPQVGSNG